MNRLYAFKNIKPVFAAHGTNMEVRGQLGIGFAYMRHICLRDQT